MPDLLDPLNEPCPKCGFLVGDHTVRDWYAHTSTISTDEPFREVSDPYSFEFGELGRIEPVDTIDLRVMVAPGTPMGGLGIVEMHFQQGNMERGPRSIARVHFVGPPDYLRKTAKLLQQGFNRAANVAGPSA